MENIFAKIDKMLEKKSNEDDSIWKPMTYKDVEKAEEQWMPDGENEDDWMACVAVEMEEKNYQVDSIICGYLILKRKRKKTIEDMELLEKVKNLYEKEYEPDYPTYMESIESAKRQYQFSKKQKVYYIQWLTEYIQFIEGNIDITLFN